jgi:hypothetical protein
VRSYTDFKSCILYNLTWSIISVFNCEWLCQFDRSYISRISLILKICLPNHFQVHYYIFLIRNFGLFPLY